jgi:hypothetical protein
MRRSFLGAALVACTAASAQAATTTSTGEAAFLAAAPGLDLDDFEDATFDGTSIGFDGGTITCSGGNLCNVFFGLSFGFAGTSLSGDNAPFFATPDTITFSFGAAITAFGIFIGGAGDVGLQTLTATLSTGDMVTVLQDDTAASGTFVGNTNYVGVLSDTPFTSISFTGTDDNDGVFFDDARWGTPAAIPVPAAGFLLAGALAGLLLARRRR